MSPMDDSFRSKCLNNPAILECCTLDIFNAWPEEAYSNIASNMLTVSDY